MFDSLSAARLVMRPQEQSICLWHCSVYCSVQSLCLIDVSTSELRHYLTFEVTGANLTGLKLWSYLFVQEVLMGSSSKVHEIHGSFQITS